MIVPGSPLRRKTGGWRIGQIVRLIDIRSYTEANEPHELWVQHEDGKRAVILFRNTEPVLEGENLWTPPFEPTLVEIEVSASELQQWVDRANSDNFAHHIRTVLAGMRMYQNKTSEVAKTMLKVRRQWEPPPESWPVTVGKQE